MNKLLGGLGIAAPPCTVQLQYGGMGGPLQLTTVKNARGQTDTLPVFSSHTDVAGEVKVIPLPGKRVEHHGVRVQLVGEIQLAADPSHPLEFITLVRDLAPPGTLTVTESFSFQFSSVDFGHDSYNGSQVRVSYVVRVTMVRGLAQTIVREFPFWVQNTNPRPPPGPPIKMEVGIEDCLHIEFEYDKGTYHLGDVVAGRIYFLLVRIKLKHMELEVKKRETVGSGSAAKSETETVAKYEIMDGAPARGECVPIRLFLAPYELGPTYINVQNKFSVRYYLNLVLVDEEDRRYFKQQELTFWRKAAEADSSL